ncbi:MAG: CPBP family glutamic-type intramembrane protease [Mucilaginibacter sp.]
MEEPVYLEIDKKACVQCDALMDVAGKFCPACGARQNSTNASSVDNTWMLLKQAALFYGIDVVFCAVSKFVSFFNTLMWDLIVVVILWITAVIFFADRWSENKRLLRWRSFSWPKLAAYIAIAMTASVIVHYSVGWLNMTLFSKDEQYNYIFAGHRVLNAITVVFFSAITPAIFEEIGYRGYLLNTLLKVSDAPQAIYISAFLFAIIHLSFISLFWLIPFGIFIGYVRLKEDTLWYGIFFHFAFNLTACIFDLF